MTNEENAVLRYERDQARAEVELQVRRIARMAYSNGVLEGRCRDVEAALAQVKAVMNEWEERSGEYRHAAITAVQEALGCYRATRSDGSAKPWCAGHAYEPWTDRGCTVAVAAADAAAVPWTLTELLMARIAAAASGGPSPRVR